jgi:diguanylate cyclase (GGDEF)-like protein
MAIFPVQGELWARSKMASEVPPGLARSSDEIREVFQQLHHLTTFGHESLDVLFDDLLKAGCRTLGAMSAMVLEVQGDCGIVRALHGEVCDISVGSVVALSETLRSCLRTQATLYDSPAGTCIATPIIAGEEIFGTLSFCAPDPMRMQNFSKFEYNYVDLIGRNIGWLILEKQTQHERERSRDLQKYQNRVLDLVAGNEYIETILMELVRMLESQARGSACTAYVVKRGSLSCVCAPGFPGFAEAYDSGAPAVDESFLGHECTQKATFFRDAADCPVWPTHGLAAQLTPFRAGLIAPITGSGGALLGFVALHYTAGALSGDGDRNLLGFAGRLAAIAIEQRQLTDRLDVQARYDTLTGLPNRSYFLDRLGTALEAAKRQSEALGVLFIDLDRFKQINDTFGHAMGDRLLAEVGGRLRQLIGQRELASRMGGDEFSIAIAREQDEDGIVRASRAILNALRAPYWLDGQELFVTPSIGLSMFPKDGSEPSDLLRNADLAMHAAKKIGKNELQVFVAENQSLPFERLQLENALRRALDNGEFELLYQPIVRIDGNLDGLEALLSWRHPVRGQIEASQFIPIAEETGLIIPIGTWVLRQACFQGNQWIKGGCPEVRINVNVSALQFERADFVEMVAAALALSHFPPECLELELTESFIMHDIEESARRMSRLRELGIRISIDDFGTGYSSLSYISRMPVDSLKIDQSFLRGMQEPAGSLPVIQTIVRLAHSLNLAVIAEGVETKEELDLMRVVGCDKVQGHLYGKSLHAEEAGAMLGQNDRAIPAGA